MLFTIAAKVSRVRVFAVKVLTPNVMEETNEELPNFTISVEDDLAVLQGTCSESKNFSNKRCFRAKIGTAML